MVEEFLGEVFMVFKVNGRGSVAANRIQSGIFRKLQGNS